ncbi:Coatomer subunit gamma-2 [Cladochytrium tenue]|nr:Coatomer subunit gamma-2 [Cladochytrium tenue]
MNFGKKDDEDSGLFSHIDKSTVLQEARAFNETPINPRKCRTILTKILFLLYQSETFQTKEATETFFSITKLFQSQDIVYLVIKELSTIAEDVIMVTSSLSKDMNSKSDQVKANAIRALCKITESSMLQGIERLLKQAIVDKNAAISSAALVSSLHLFAGNRDVVKRWSNEVQEAVNSKGAITQYHALGLLYQIRQNDRMAVIKLIQSYSRSQLRSPLAYCMLIRFIAKIMDEDESSRRPLFETLEGWLRHRSDMVVYEAARAICNLRNVTSQELFPAVSALQLMLVNHKPTLRFAAIRTLNKLAMTHPAAVAPCNLDMENLITDPNRSIATFAITTLLKTGNEVSVDRLMKQISGFMSEISDEFKIIVVEAIRSLCLKFPTKQSLMINFLSNVLRDEGGFEYKRAIVEAIFDIIHHIPESKEYALSHLCEFIEDCEFTKLSVRILHLLGVEGPKTSSPSKYIRYIYNRIILENATVKAAAVTAMARFAEGTFSWAALEVNLVNYLANDASQVKPFDISSTPTVSRAEEEAEALRKKEALHEPQISQPAGTAAGTQGGNAAPAAGGDSRSGYRQVMERIPKLAVLGSLIKSSKIIELTESETDEFLLENVSVECKVKQSEDETAAMLVEDFTIQLPQLVYDVPGSVYVVYKRPNGITPSACFSNILRFTLKEIDPSTGEPGEDGIEDDYPLEDLDVSIGDYVVPSYVADFKKAWEDLGEDNEQVETYSLTAVASVKAAVAQVLDVLGMDPSDGSDRVKDKATVHTLYVSGSFLGQVPALARARMAFEAGSGVTMELAVRSAHEGVALLLVNAIV